MDVDLLNKTILVHRRTSGEYLNQNHAGVKYRHESLVERILVPIIEPLTGEIQHFIQCIVDRNSPIVTIRDGLRALQLAMTIRQTIAECDGITFQQPVLLGV
jgi:virulence factor